MGECFLYTEEVLGSNPRVPTASLKDTRGRIQKLSRKLKAHELARLFLS